MRLSAGSWVRCLRGSTGNGAPPSSAPATGAGGVIHFSMSPSPDAAEAAPLPDDVATLKALLLAERAMAAKLAGHNEYSVS
jgi:hypothetical protein